RMSSTEALRSAALAGTTGLQPNRRASASDQEIDGDTRSCTWHCGVRWYESRGILRAPWIARGYQRFHSSSKFKATSWLLGGLPPRPSPDPWFPNHGPATQSRLKV